MRPNLPRAAKALRGLEIAVRNLASAKRKTPPGNGVVDDDFADLLSFGEHAGESKGVVSIYFAVSDNSGLDREVLRTTIFLRNANIRSKDSRHAVACKF